MAYGEEGITEHNLLLLKLNCPSQIKLQSFTRKQEALNGADWEWWFGRPGRWQGMRVQAKRIGYPREHFSTIHTYKSNNSQLTQIDTLIAAANADGIDPVYCLYAAEPASPKQGCHVGSALAIKASGKTKYRDLEPLLQPWENLVCPSHGQSIGADVADLARDTVTRSIQALRQTYPDDQMVELFRASEPRSSLPDYLQRLASDEDDDSLSQVAERKSVQGFMIVESTSEDQERD